MSDERPDNDGAPRFGRRPRQGNTPPPQQHAGEHGHQAPKPKVRIGPRRPDAPPAAPTAPRDPMKPQGGVRKPAGRDGNNGRNGAQHGGQPQGGQHRGNGQGQQGQHGQQGRHKKKRKDKFRNPRPEGGFAPPEPREPKPQDGLQGDLFEAPGEPRAQDSSAGDSSAGTGGGSSQGLGRNARRRKRRRERRDEARIPETDVFEPAGALDMPSTDSVDVSFEEDESDLNLVEAPPPGSSLPNMSESVDDDDDGSEDDDVPESDQAPEGAQAAPAEPRESRSKRRRKKRRDRMEAAVVDRSTGFWWADQWTRSFEAIYGGGASRARLQKGRSYSRRGQVTELEVGPNGVIARVQGSRPKPYQVRVELNRLRRETWGRILHQLAGKAAFLAQLLEGTLPPEIEDVFFDAGARLFPHGDSDVRSRCTCPDPVVPCKHVAAVHYALAEALQRDPFLLFALRGKSRDQFLQDLRDMRGRDGAKRESAAPLAEDLGQFWRMGRLAESVLRPTGWGSGGDPARLVQSLGEPQLEGIREGLFLPMLESTYRQVSEGMRRLPKDG